MFSTLIARHFSQYSVRIPVLALLALLVSGQVIAQSDEEAPRIVVSTSMGDIVLELEQTRAPQTVKNFLQYVDDGFYAETLFHRVIEGFMIQGGGFDKRYQRKPTRSPISNEAYNGLRNDRYTIAMARTTEPHSATSQFFINSADNNNLDHTGTNQRGWGYTVFGKVVEGRDIVDAIAQTRTGPGGPFSRDVPAEPVVILSAARLIIAEPDAAEPANDNSEINSTSAMDKPASSAAPSNGIKVNAAIESSTTDESTQQQAEQN